MYYNYDGTALKLENRGVPALTGLRVDISKPLDMKIYVKGMSETSLAEYYPLKVTVCQSAPEDTITRSAESLAWGEQKYQGFHIYSGSSVVAQY